ncbi:bifunctional NAD(P)/FAD-dependent oxidoreductase/class I SAM-dependent methyltransferase [Streptomyces sp. TRM 70351]|uniref:bifunctional NAD(P)/FAD-dependent oxidoreductase/class I SAM-dependent methyltransferase n=1 Tax=Streptomyces sp. TRM 70351 TaxID=3116552 RepID=UPI002E7AE018|nr:bifunctional NAD(P)/FAD-dependent oxidoreductase/class I SAM-dependent methyltransferase [Streptomyces sp. TRM 70351]MEE1927147.1 bifunctional NAD(P)/FAD-dependent oxidoreductase/class I SAM-dependent methyltransferase [Streptomyces sp. TRM 70351]
MDTRTEQPAAAPAEQLGHHEVVVVGGGAAGLSAALVLARARRSVLVVDAGQPRNAPAGHVHGYLGQEGVPPGELLARGRDEVTGYGGTIVTGTVTEAARVDGGGFRVVLADGRAALADRLVVTTGLTDELPPVPGLAGRFGHDVLHCPYCHGWEVRDQPVGVLATGPLAAHQALLWRQWSKDVTLFLHTVPGLGDDDAEQLAARGVTVVTGEVTGLDVTGGRLTGVTLADGRTAPCAVLVVAPRFTARSGLLTGLGLTATDVERDGHVIGRRVAADPDGATEVPGVWVAGNVTDLTQQVVGAAEAGRRAAAAVNLDLLAEETRRAVAVHREQQRTAEEFWDARYGESERIWSGEPNAALVRESAGLAPGTALDLGCGEGADAVWLARQGWRVTAVDVSGVALERAGRHGREAGVADRVDWQRHDLAQSFPAGPDGGFDLVLAAFLHSRGDLPREEVLRSAAGAVRPGGTLLVVGHAGVASWEHAARVRLPTADEVLESLRLPEGQWEVLVSAEHDREHPGGPGGPQAPRRDNTLKLRRLPG